MHAKWAGLGMVFVGGVLGLVAAIAFLAPSMLSPRGALLPARGLAMVAQATLTPSDADLAQATAGPPPTFQITYDMSGGIAGFHHVLQIGADGVARLYDRGNPLGTHTLSPAALDILRGQFASANFMDLKDHYDSGTVADDIYHSITLAQDGKVHSVVLAEVGGHDSAPPALYDLVAALRQIGGQIANAGSEAVATVTATPATSLGTPNPPSPTPPAASVTVPPPVATVPPTASAPTALPVSATAQPPKASATASVTPPPAASATAHPPKASATVPPPAASATAPPHAATATAVPPAVSVTVQPPAATSTMAVPATAGPSLGGQVAYVAAGKILARDPNKGGVTTLVADPDTGQVPEYLQWSPSGRKLLWEVQPASHVLVYDFDLHQQWDLGAGHGAAWNADSSRVAFTRLLGTMSSGGDSVIVSTLATATTPADEKILGMGSTPAWLPGSTPERLAVARAGDIWLLDYPPGGAETQLTHQSKPDDRWIIEGLLYHYSGRILFYGSSAANTPGSGKGLGLYAASLHTGETTLLLATTGTDLGHMEISPDGRYVALGFNKSNGCPATGQVMVYNLASGKDVTLGIQANNTIRTLLTGVSWAPQQAPRLILSYGSYECGPDPSPLKAAHLYWADLAAPNDLHALGDGAWPAWNRGREALGQQGPLGPAGR